MTSHKTKTAHIPSDRRHETIAGLSVTIISRDGVETVRGGPKCVWCGKSLRPRYLTKRQGQQTHHFYDHRPKNVPTEFDADRKQWLVTSIAYRVVLRTFEGCFGTYGDNRFCGLNCGRDYGLAVAEGVAAGDLKVSDKRGNQAVITKAVRTLEVTPSRKQKPSIKKMA